MVDIEISPFGEHESRPDEPTGENVPLTPVGGGSTWEPEREQETSFRGGRTQEGKLTDSCVDSLYMEYLSIIAEHLMEPIMITLDMKAGSFTSEAGMSHSPMRIES